MKTLVEVQEVEKEGFLALLGQVITVYCTGFIYTGKLVGVNDSCIKLSGASIVYDTGSFTNKSWTTSEKFPGTGDWYIQCSSIESFGILK